MDNQTAFIIIYLLTLLSGILLGHGGNVTMGHGYALRKRDESIVMGMIVITFILFVLVVGAIIGASVVLIVTL